MTNESLRLSEEYLRLGLIGLSRSIDQSWNLGHYGAAVIASYFFCQENLLDPLILKSVKRQTDRLISKHKAFFVPFPKEEANPDLLENISSALNENIEDLHGIGHNIIFATFALRALNIVPEMAIPSMVDSICRLIRMFDNIDRGGPFPGWDDNQQVTVQEADQIPPYSSEATICQITLDEMMKFKRIYYGVHQGVVGHLMTSAEALIQLARLGHVELATKGHKAHRVYIKLSRKSQDYDFPGKDYVLATPNPHHPLTHEYWESDLEREDNWLYGHRLKFVYSFYELMRTLDFPDDLFRYEKQLSYLL